jgi:hypothetical protein
MEHANKRDIPWALFVSELIGTALLVLVGLSLVILMVGTDNHLVTSASSSRAMPRPIGPIP